MLCVICYEYVQFKKREKDLRPKPATLLNVTLLHGCFLRFFFHCTNDTKSRNASHIYFFNFPLLFNLWALFNEAFFIRALS